MPITSRLGKPVITLGKGDIEVRVHKTGKGSANLCLGPLDHIAHVTIEFTTPESMKQLADTLMKAYRETIRSTDFAKIIE